MNGWWIVLALLPLFLFLSTISSHDPSHSPPYSKSVASSVFWANLAVGVRAVVGVLRRERSRVWVVYLALYIVLPAFADMAKTYAVRQGWVP